MRFALASMACVVGALASLYHWNSSRHEQAAHAAIGEPAPAMRHARSLPQSTEPLRPRLAAARAAQVSAAADTAFSPLAVLSLGSPVDAVVIGDVTGDGRDDVVASTHHVPASEGNPETNYKVSVFVQRADGTLAPALRASFPGYYMHGEDKGFALVDLNEDGIREILLGYGEGLYLFEGAASGTLAGRGVPGITGTVKALSSMDVNRDTHADVVTFDGFRLKVYLGNGRGLLQLSSDVSTYPVAVNNLHAHISPGDLNGDGLLDLATFNGFNEGAVFLQTQSASFVYSNLLLNPYPENYFSAMAVADFDSDGDDDLMFATHVTDRNYPLAKHYVYRQDGGKLTAPVRWNSYNIATAMLGADMDRDGRNDLITVRTPANEVASIGYSRQTAPGVFGPETRFPLTQPIYITSSRGLAVGDFTGDGCKDIAAASGYNLVLLKAGCPRLRVMAGPLPPRLGKSPVAAPSGASVATKVPMHDAGPIRAADPILKNRVRQTVR
ncbi:MAG: VCBS repeat-containing protein [Pseudoxanthomonas sp.]